MPYGMGYYLPGPRPFIREVNVCYPRLLQHLSLCLRRLAG